LRKFRLIVNQTARSSIHTPTSLDISSLNSINEETKKSEHRIFRFGLW
jgi:hypothetical protein